ncbi:hypothetical protein [Streptomyces sp. t39]|uniref:hypothetical protein n=1 Tax=Streptomyces sp. t39 TaxID=1828156 RepID=UPI0011CEB3CE|nr:hypothetical protein [Streptomyces sp. t39]TXS35580.1 hypothetical protein EAO77_36465 [Streptomyces sp. t39]
MNPDAEPGHLVLAVRRTDRWGDTGLAVFLPCPVDTDCPGPAWAPVESLADLHSVAVGDLDAHPRIACAVHGLPNA